jgi:hypothetical protein
MRHQALNLATVENTHNRDTEVTKVTPNDGRPQDGDLLLTEIDRVRRESREIADGFRSRFDRLETDHRATKRLVSRSIGDIGKHSETIEGHRKGLVDHAVHLENHARQLKELGEQLDALRIDLYTMSAVDQADYDRRLALEERLEHQSVRRSHTRTRRCPAKHAPWAIYYAAAVVAGGFLSFLIENHIIF